jgi:hypothetical protein
METTKSTDKILQDYYIGESAPISIINLYDVISSNNIPPAIFLVEKRLSELVVEGLQPTYQILPEEFGQRAERVASSGVVNVPRTPLPNINIRKKTFIETMFERYCRRKIVPVN